MPKVILVVEDDDDARDIHREALLEKGYQVLTARHGAEGVHMARKHRPDLILMDIRMPVMDGWQAIQYLKADPAVSHITIWGISAFISDEELEKQPSWLHFDRLIPKPVDPTALANEVEELLGRTSPPPRPLP